jgi:amidase
MFPSRAVGHLRPPTSQQVAEYADRAGLHLTPEEQELLAAMAAGTMATFDRIEELDSPAVPLRHPYRDPGHPPVAGEDPYNAFIRFCEVRGAETGPLAGRTVAVKDCIAVAGVPMTNGGRRLPHYVPTEDAVVVERLLDAGATVIGKTNLDDLAAGLGEGSYYGAARNPLSPAFSTGGSSSGSGAAVAAGMADLALGADEAGSVRIPAAWCGLVGMKATHGLVPSAGLAVWDHSLDHIGPMTKTVADNALMLEVIAGGDWRDAQWVRADPKPGQYTAAAGQGVDGLRVGVVTQGLDPAGVSPDVRAAFDGAVERLGKLGVAVSEVSVPLWTDAMTIEMGIITHSLAAMFRSNGQAFFHLGRLDPNAAATMAAQLALQADDLPLMVKGFLVTGEYLRERYLGVHFARAQNLRLELRRQVSAALGEVDLLITPTTPKVAFELAEGRLTATEWLGRPGMEAVTNTCPLDMTGHPALTLPCGTGAHDLPVGLQIIGPHFGEELVYRLAFAAEEAVA